MKANHPAESELHLSISDAEFGRFQDFMQRQAGIHLSNAKKALVCSRLARRLKQFRLGSFGEYYRLLQAGSHPSEVQLAVDLLTTNETYFFREPRHFEFLRGQALHTRPRGSAAGGTFRVWSAACSSGEEPYSVAMTLADTLGEHGWQIMASDISASVLARAASGHYPLERAETVPQDYLKRYCLKGTGPQQGTFLVKPAIRRQVEFVHLNLNGVLPDLGLFDVVLLRNVMIYFDQDTKRALAERVARVLKPHGHLLVGHSESLNGLCDALVPVSPSVYRRP